MSGIANVVKMLLVPGSIPFLAFGLVLGVALLYGGKRAMRFGRAWLTGLLAVYLLLSMPLGAELLVSPLISGFNAVRSPEEARGASTVVVLAVGGEVYRASGQEITELGKASAFNVLEGARLYRLLHPELVVASGGIVNPGSRQRSEGDVLGEHLVRLGVPSARLLVEGRSQTTRQQAEYVAEMLKPRGIRQVVLVTAADHMARATSTFRDVGLDPIPSVATFIMPPPPGLMYWIRPNINSLRQADWGCYEYMARLYYWFQGW